MDPRLALAFLIFLIVLAGVTLLAEFATRRTTTQTIRRRHLTAALNVITEIEEATDKYTDLDHIAAAEIRSIIRQYRKEHRTLT